MSIAVTGATGQLGRLVVDELLSTTDPADLVAVVRDEAKAAPLADRGVTVRVAPYGDIPALTVALADVDTLLLISSNEVGQRFTQHVSVIDAAKASGVGHVVYTSAPRATTSTLILAPEHKATEEHLADSGLDHTVLRNNWYHENYAPQIDVARQTGTLVAAAGEGRVASASRRDFAAAAAVVLTGTTGRGRVHELTGDVAWDYHELAAVLTEVVGRQVVYQPAEPTELIGILTGSGLDEATAGFVAALDGNIAEGLLAEVTTDLRDLIGRLATPLVDTLRTLA